MVRHRGCRSGVLERSTMRAALPRNESAEIIRPYRSPRRRSPALESSNRLAFAPRTVVTRISPAIASTRRMTARKIHSPRAAPGIMGNDSMIADASVRLGNDQPQNHVDEKPGERHRQNRHGEEDHACE